MPNSSSKSRVEPNQNLSTAPVPIPAPQSQYSTGFEESLAEKKFKSLRFSISQNVRDIKLMESFIPYLDCGSIQINKTKSTCEFVVNKFEDIQKKIIPLIVKYPLQGTKLLNFKDFTLGAEIIKNKN